ncbi:MAG: LamG domain-containing protein [Bacteroidia bacterium]|nr:LamG domain-containing protein [Bacteroidia bacterium]
METLLNRNFKIRGDLSCFYKPGTIPSNIQVAGIEVQLWHKTPMQAIFLGKGITNSDGAFIIEFEIDSPVDYIINGKITNAFLEAYYNGQKLDFTIPAYLLEGLVAYWKLDELSGTAAADATGNGHTATLSGATLPDWQAGKINNGLYINGGLDGTVDSGLVIPASTDFNFGTGDFTIAFWMLANNTSNSFMMVDSGYPNIESLLMQFVVGGPFVVAISGSVMYSRSYSLVPGNWYHFVLRRIGENFEVCVNGTPLGAAVNTEVVSVVAPNLILATFTDISGPQSLDGLIDEIAIWKGHGLTDAEVSFLYNNSNGLQYPFKLKN